LNLGFQAPGGYSLAVSYSPVPALSLDGSISGFTGTVDRYRAAVVAARIGATYRFRPGFDLVTPTVKLTTGVHAFDFKSERGAVPFIEGLVGVELPAEFLRVQFGVGAAKEVGAGKFSPALSFGVMFPLPL
jgi:hypothetical protein